MNPKIIPIGKNYNGKSNSKRTIILPAGSYFKGKEVIGRTVIQPMHKETQPSIQKETLLANFKDYLMGIGFKKIKNNRWEKATEQFLQIVLVEASRWQKGDYDIRVGTLLIGLLPDIDNSWVGHFHTIFQNRKTTLKKIYKEMNEFFKIWTDKKSIRKIIEQKEIAIKELDNKYPEEKLDNYLIEKVNIKKTKAYKKLYKKHNELQVGAYHPITEFVLSPEFLN